MTVNPFHTAMPWQCACRVPVTLKRSLIPDDVTVTVTLTKTQPGRKAFCGLCGTRRP